MGSFEVSKRVLLAVDAVNKSKRLGYDNLASKIEKIALKHNLTVTHIRAISGVKFTPIDDIISNHIFGRTKQFDTKYKKLTKTDKARVNQAIKELENV